MNALTHPRCDTERRAKGAGGPREALPTALDPTRLGELEALLDGEVLTDPASRRLYAADASPYEVVPLGVARPRHARDCVTLVEYACRHRIPLIPRGGGTNLAGQCLGRGLVVDCSRHMTALLEVDPEARTARVQPGIVLDELNRRLSPWALRFGPDPSTGNRCVIGGMIGSNAWGPHILLHGTTRENLLSAEAVLGDASLVRLGPLTEPELEQRCRLPGPEGRVHRELRRLITEHRREILEREPRGVPCNAGYALANLARGRPWVSDGPPFNLAPLLCGSEGTLALLTEATLRLVPVAADRLMVLAAFRSLEDSLRAVPPVLEHRPAAVELLDRAILELARGRRAHPWPRGDPAAVLLCELWGEDRDRLREQGQALIRGLQAAGLGEDWSILEPPELDGLWELRRSGLGLLMGRPGPPAVSGMEDAAVPVDALPHYARRVAEILERRGLAAVVYGSVSAGLVHLRPLLDLRRAEGRAQFAGTMGEIAGLVREEGGCFSAKHGDGRLRAPFLADVLGPDGVALLRRVKAAFDPQALLNPGSILDPPPLLEDLRATPSIDSAGARTWFEWDEGLGGAASRCKGAGVCRRQSGGIMCPSYMATLEERDSTRGRANLYREVLAEQGTAGLTSPLLREVLDLCLACKACKTECPASVDMARLKAELLAHVHRQRGLPLRDLVLGEFHRMLRVGALWPALANALLDLRPTRRLLALAPDRRLPRIAPRSLSALLRRRAPPPGGAPNGKLVLLIDPIVEHLEPEVGIAAVGLLERAGWEVVPTPCLSSGRAQISHGLLDRARGSLRRALSVLHPRAVEGIPIIGLEPAEVLTFRDEAIDLLPAGLWRDRARSVAAHLFLLEEFLIREIEAGRFAIAPVPGGAPRILVHGHCHQRALIGLEPTLELLRSIPGAEVEALDTTCCGMAGSFGYEREHAGLSRQIAELGLFPAIRRAGPDCWVVATGASCRQQISAGLGRRALHPAQVLRAVSEASIGGEALPEEG